MTKKYWTTLDQLEENSDYLKTRDEEFKAKPYEDMEEGGFLKSSRRNFIKASGAAAVFMGAAGCNSEKKLVPYHSQPEELIPGNPIYYASIDESGENGFLVKTTEGRPIKTDGNPEHPVNLGKLDAVGNAAILDLYDPDRLRFPVDKQGNQTSFENAEKTIFDALKKAGQNAVWVTRSIHGPAQRELVNQFLASFPGLKHIELSNVDVDAFVAAQKKSYGERVLPTLRYDKAKVIVSLGFDLLSESPNPMEVSRLFANAKRLKGDMSMSRVITFEPHLTALGSMSDERYRIKPTDLRVIAYGLAAEIKAVSGKSVSGNVAKILSAIQPREIEKSCGLKNGLLKDLAKELWENKGHGLVVAGGTAAHDGDAVSFLSIVNYINYLLENDGKTVQYGNAAMLHHNHTEGGVVKLMQMLNSGKVQALLVQDLNLSYVLPSSLGFDKAIQNIAFKAGFLSHYNETAKHCDVVLPTLHTLESWSDAEPRKGLYALGQPTIDPLWKSKAKQDYLIALIKLSGRRDFQKTDWESYIKQVWKKKVYSGNVLAASFENFWTSALRLGVYDKSAKEREKSLPVRKFRDAAIKPLAPKASKGKTLVLFKTAMHQDGFSMNNPWLLEAPDPISKICWDNYASVSIKTARKEGYKEGDILKISTSAGSIEVPVHIQPGVTNDVYAVALGWGRPDGGQVAAGAKGVGVGVDASTLASSISGEIQYVGLDINVSKTDKKTKLACVQGHQYLENEGIRATGEGSRKIVQDTTLKQFKDPKDHSYEIHYHAPTDVSLWRQKYPTADRKWAMVVDTNVCNGCNACSISCQAENNVSVVGKDEVIINREMHWIRIDRYYTSKNEEHPEDTDEVDVIHQTMLCQHCDNAPCETVCPVVATSHNAEGLNVQTYNRCVGTRYCSNNCPYKVRHYNWYDYSDYRAGLHGSGNPLSRFIRSLKEDIKDKIEYPLMMQFNPDVTVRSRGVMEKCSFCIQRIRRWRTEEKSLGRDLPESQKQSACQQACPSDAITFGNILDENSKVFKESQKVGAYKVLKELNTEANVTYTTKIRNRAPSSVIASHKTDGHSSHH